MDTLGTCGGYLIYGIAYGLILMYVAHASVPVLCKWWKSFKAYVKAKKG